MHAKFKINNYLIDSDDNTVTRGSDKKHIEPKAMHVLLELARNAEKTVERQQLLQAVWGNRVVVDEALTRIISQLRATFDDSKTRTLIQTVPKKGYRLNATIDWQCDIASCNSQSETDSINPLKRGEKEAATHIDSHIVNASLHEGSPEQASSASGPASDSSARNRIIISVVALLVIVLAGSAAVWLMNVSDKAQPLTIAVLPLEAPGESNDAEYLAQGLPEELMGALSRFNELHVPSRYSTFAYAKRHSGLQEIATELKVRYLVEGTVREQGESFRIVLRLVDARADKTLWSQSYESDKLSLPQVINNAAAGITSLLVPALETSLIETIPSASGPAYQAYMRGKYWLMNGTTSEWFYAASAAFEEAIDLDPEYAQAYGSLAYVYARYNYHDAYLEDRTARRKAIQAINKALSLNAEERNALLAKAILAISAQQFERAEAALDTVLSLNTADSTALYLFSELRLAQNQFDQALVLALEAKEADPLSPWVNVNLAIVHYWRQEYPQALNAANDAIDIDTNYTWAYVWKAKTLQRSGQIAQAIETMQQCLQIDDDSPVNMAFTGLLYLELDLPREAGHYFQQTAALFGDSTDARFWKGFQRFGYKQQASAVAIELLSELRLLDNRIFSLLPLLTSLYIKEERVEEGLKAIQQRSRGDNGEMLKVNYLTIDNNAALTVLEHLSHTSGQNGGPTKFEQFPVSTPVIYPLISSGSVGPEHLKLSSQKQNNWWSDLWVLPSFDSSRLSKGSRASYENFVSKREQQRQLLHRQK